MHHATRIRVRSYSTVGLLYVRLPSTARSIIVQGSWSSPIPMGQFHRKEGLPSSRTASGIPLLVVCAFQIWSSHGHAHPNHSFRLLLPFFLLVLSLMLGICLLFTTMGT